MKLVVGSIPNNQLRANQQRPTRWVHRAGRCVITAALEYNGCDAVAQHAIGALDG